MVTPPMNCFLLLNLGYGLGSSALNRSEEKLDRINPIYRIMTDKIVIIVSILSIMGSIFCHLHVSTV